VLDLVGGIADLRARQIRAIGDPTARFREDALRLLRLVRFASRLGFEIEERTLAAARDKANLIVKISAERVRDELALMWSGAQPELALRWLRELKLLDRVLPEVAKLNGRPDGERTEKRLQLLARDAKLRSSALGWAAVLADTGSIEQIESSGKRLKLSREETERVCFIVAANLKIREAFEMREATLLRFIAEPWLEEALAFHRVDALATDGNLAQYEFCFSRLRAMRAQGTLTRNWIDGKDLIEIGFSPGPEFSEILRTVEDLALEGKLKSKEEALAYVVRHWVK
jgi:poly(A) polymerase